MRPKNSRLKLHTKSLFAPVSKLGRSTLLLGMMGQPGTKSWIWKCHWRSGWSFGELVRTAFQLGTSCINAEWMWIHGANSAFNKLRLCTISYGNAHLLKMCGLCSVAKLKSATTWPVTSSFYFDKCRESSVNRSWRNGLSQHGRYGLRGTNFTSNTTKLTQRWLQTWHVDCLKSTSSSWTHGDKTSLLRCFIVLACVISYNIL